MHAQGALLDAADRTWRDHPGPFRYRVFAVAPVEDAHPVRAGGHAVPAADAVVLVDEHDAFGVGPGGRGRAHLLTRCIVTVLAGQRHPVEVVATAVVARRCVERGAVGEDPVPPHTQRHRVLALADHGARPAADASFEVDGHPPSRMFGTHVDRAVGAARGRQRFDRGHSAGRFSRHVAPRSCSPSIRSTVPTCSGRSGPRGSG